MPHPCDVVKIKYKALMERRFSYAFWVGTNMHRNLFLTKGSIREGMTYHTEDDYTLIYPNPKYITEFLGTVDISRFEELKRICKVSLRLQSSWMSKDRRYRGQPGRYLKLRTGFLQLLPACGTRIFLSPLLRWLGFLKKIRDIWMGLHKP
jgi:hypothetical protein